MVEKVKCSEGIYDLIYALESLAYYFTMKPKEFWSSTYREINMFTQANLYKVVDDFKREINLFEAATDKVIMADAMSNKRPKIVPLQKTFAKLFPENDKEYIQSPEEITRIMRTMMKSNV